MKEMTIEEKARAYDEAIEKLRSLHDDYDTVSTLIDVKEELENIFPELKESEDEKIRKDIISHFAKGIEGSSFDEVREKYKIWIAWLEKQAEQKSVEWSDEDKENLYHIDALIKDSSLEVRRQEYLSNWLKSLKDRCLSQSQPKQERSEEDERNLNWVINVWNRLRHGGDAQTTPNQMECLEKWLNSLKDRVQPKQEWSEEDERILREMITIFGLENFEGYNIGKNNEDALKFLNSLKDRYIWKPSDEQIEALVSAIDVMIDNRGAGDKKTILLSGLYHELKTL